MCLRVNAAVNLARRRAPGEPFLASHTYDLSRVMSVVQEQLVGTMNVLLEPQEGLNTALLFVEAPIGAGTGRGLAVPAPGTTGRAGVVDVATLIQDTSIDDLNRSAEEYFASLKDWEHHLTKPFSQAHETPTLLAGMAAVLQGLELMPGATVLEFGAGTGWLSRYLTQLGCRSILLDVSPTALDIARELYARLPIIGERPAPRFLVFDGRRIDLPDGSVDRILCFHAFHHVPDPAAMVREFGRVLAPGGIAGFAEPGPRHSTVALLAIRDADVQSRRKRRGRPWHLARGQSVRLLRHQAGVVSRVPLARVPAGIRRLSGRRRDDDAMGGVHACVPAQYANVLSRQGGDCAL